MRSTLIGAVIVIVLAMATETTTTAVRIPPRVSRVIHDIDMLANIIPREVHPLLIDQAKELVSDILRDPHPRSRREWTEVMNTLDEHFLALQAVSRNSPPKPQAQQQSPPSLQETPISFFTAMIILFCVACVIGALPCPS